MQVSQIAELDTHAIIGGGKAQAFAMSDSAEFFTVLSDTLYRDKKRAVVREVICNAWDAHIASGKTKTPIQITLSEDELVIKDFGPGIADEMIVPIYCVYGGSTKVKDHKQTGGFGLGSKAPFAYSDYFSVTSCHAAFRTVYAISRGGIETEGRPEIRQMVRVPTDETGITVSVPLKDKDDFSEFRNHIREVVYQGGINAVLNDSALPTLDYGQARKTGHATLLGSSLNESFVYVLYGTVLYPLSTTDADLTRKVEELRQLGERNVRHILIAAPNTIGVTPNREALSYSEKTTATLHQLLDKAINLYSPGNMRRSLKRLTEAQAKSHSRYSLKYYPDSGRVNVTLTSGLTADPEQILTRTIASRIYHNQIDWTEYRRQILRIYSRQFRDDRRIFRRMASRTIIRRNDHQQDDAEKVRHSTRLALRMAAKLNLLPNLRIMANHALCGTLIQPKRWKNGWVDKVLLVAPNHRDALSWNVKRMNTSATVQRERKDGPGSLVLVISKLSDEMRKQIATLATHFGFTVHYVEATKPEKRPKVEKKADVYHHISELKGVRPIKTEPKTAAAKDGFHLRAYVGSDDYVRPSIAEYYLEIVRRRFPTCLVALRADEERKLLALGSRDVIDVMTEQMTVLAKDRAAQYARYAMNGDFVDGWAGYDTISATIEKLVKLDHRLAKFFFPDPVVITDQIVTDVTELSAVLNSIQDYKALAEQRAKAKLAADELQKNAKAAFKKVSKDAATLARLFHYIAPLRGVSPSRQDVPEVLELLRVLKRRAADKAKLTATQPLKEAA